MIKKLETNDTMFGLMWCVAAQDNKKVGFTKIIKFQTMKEIFYKIFLSQIKLKQVNIYQ